MFGYVIVNEPELKIKEYRKYKGVYCGLCQTLKRKYGPLGQLCLNNDMTFAALLLMGLYEDEEAGITAAGFIRRKRDAFMKIPVWNMRRI